MSIVRIGEMQATLKSIDPLREFLSSILPMIKSSKGCESVALYQSQDNPARFVITEIWDSIESHQASLTNIPPEMLAEIRPLLATAPSGSYFDVLKVE